MNLFLAEDIGDSSGYLNTEESHHASRVLRLSPGDELLVTEGKGIIYRASIVELHKKRLHFRVNDTYREEIQPQKLHLAVAPTKSNDRFEFFLEKATELGVSRLTPIICSNSERKVYKSERGRKVVQSAAKQSLSCWWPNLDDQRNFKEFIKDESLDMPRYIAFCGDGEKVDLRPKLPEMEKALVLIGPEGDFSEQEIEFALEHGFQLASLGKKRLRTETAALSVALAFNLNS